MLYALKFYYLKIYLIIKTVSIRDKRRHGIKVIIALFIKARFNIMVLDMTKNEYLGNP